MRNSKDFTQVRISKTGRARALILALLMTVTTVLAAPFAGDFGKAYAATTTTVATFEQLKAVVHGSDGYSNVDTIIIDPQAAKALTDNTNANDEKEDVTYDGDTFYIPFDEPLKVDRKITIKSNVPVVFARSEKFNRDQDHPGLFNITSANGDLIIDGTHNNGAGTITMTGEEVTATFDEGQNYIASQEQVKVTLRGYYVDNGNVITEDLYLGGTSTNLTISNQVTNWEFWVEEDGRLATMLNDVKHYVQCQSNYSLVLRNEKSDDDLRVRQTDGNEVTNFQDQGGYVLYNPYYEKYLDNGLRGCDLNSAQKFLATVYSEESQNSSDATGSFNYSSGDFGNGNKLSDLYWTDGARPLMIGDGNGKFLATPKGAFDDMDQGKGYVTPVWLDYDDVFPDTPDTSDTYNGIYTGAIWDLWQIGRDNFSGAAETGKYYLKNKDEFVLGMNVNPATGVLYAFYDGNQYTSLNRTFIGVNAENSNQLSYREYVTSGGVTYWSYNSNWVVDLLDRTTDFLQFHDLNKTKYVGGNGSVTNTDGNKLHVYKFNTVKDSFEYDDDDDSSDSGSGNATGGTVSKDGQNYVAPKFTFDVNPKDGSADDKAVWTKGEILENSGYFIHVKRGEATLNSGVTLRDLHTANDVKWAAPVYVDGTSKNAKFTMNGAKITGNDVGYVPVDDESLSNGNLIEKLMNDINTSNMTNTAGGIIFNGSKAEGILTNAEISENRADAGAVIVTDGATVTMNNGTKLNNNIGYHHAGAAQVERGGKFIMNGGEMDGNVAWLKGGAVWATQWGTNGYANLNWSVWPRQFPILKNPDDAGDDGVFVMKGGTLNNNTAFARGGAIEVESNGVVLEKGDITNNKCRALGGAIYVEGDASTYSYTLTLDNAYIGSNKSVTHSKSDNDENIILNRYLDNGTLTEGGNDSWNNAFQGAMGNGGGVWLCPVGGSSVFASNNVIIDNNTAVRNGQDFYLNRGNGAMLVQNIAGNWYDEGSRQMVDFTDDNGTVLNGPVSLTNKGKNADGSSNYSASDVSDGVHITGNLSRDGGGIAANGTLIFGPPADVDRYDARITITKEWKDVPANERESVSFRIGYMDGNTFVPLNSATSEVADSDGETSSNSYDFTLNGEADGSNEGSAVSEMDPEENKWIASAFIPSSVIVNGEPMALYKFVNPDNANETWDPTVKADLSKIRAALVSKKQLEVTDWKIKVQEVDANFKVTIRDITIDNSKTKVEATEVPLYDPVTGAKKTGFNIYFTTAEFDETIINEPNYIKLKKVDVDGNPVSGATFELYKLTNGNNWFVENSRGGQTGQISTACDTITSGDDGTLIIPATVGAGDYMLFETSVPASNTKVQRAKSPWRINISNKRIATVYPFTANNNAPEAGYVVRQNADGYFTVYEKDIYDDDVTQWLTNAKNNSVGKTKGTWWLKAWYNTASDDKDSDGVNLLINDRPQIELFKVEGKYYDSSRGKNSTPSPKTTIGGAKFDVYFASDNNGGYLRGDKIGSVTSEADGKITLPLKASNDKGDKGGNQLIWLEETDATTWYQKSSRPWILWLKNGKLMEIYVFNKDVTDVSGGSGKHINKNGLLYTYQTSSANGANPYIYNEPKKVEFTKIADNTQQSLGNIRFGLYECGNKTLADFETALGSTYQSLDTWAANKVHVSKGSLKETATSDSTTGKFEFRLYGAGVYLIFEDPTTVPVGYEKSKLDAPIGILLVNEDSTYQLRVLNDYDAATSPDEDTYWDVSGYKKADSLTFINKSKEISIEFDKVDIASQASLDGVKFDLYYAKQDFKNGIDSSNGYVYRVDTSKPNNGKVNTSAIEVGDNGKYKLPITDPMTQNGLYLLFETQKQSDDYITPAAPWGLNVEYDASTGESSVSGYRLIRAGDTVGSNTYTIDDQIRIENKYKDITDPTQIAVECTDLIRLSSFKIENEKKPIELVKVKGTRLQTLSYDTNTKLVGAKFNLYEATKSTESGRDSYSRTGSALKQLESVENGVITLPREITSRQGTHYYWIEETEAVKGYVKSPYPWVLEVENGVLRLVRIADGVSGTYQVGSTTIPGGQFVTVFSNGSGTSNVGKTAYIHNEPITVYKTNDDGSDKLTGAKFIIREAKTAKWGQNYVVDVSNNGIWGVVESKAGGMIDLSEVVSDHIGSNASVSFLMFEDVAPSGYQKAVAPWLVEVERDGVITVTECFRRDIEKDVYYSDNKKVDTKTTNNTEYWPVTWFNTDRQNDNLPNSPQELEFTKVDSNTSETLAGAEFELYYVKYNSSTQKYEIDTDYGVNGKFGDTIVTDAKGVGRITGVTQRTGYQFLMFETKAPDGYIRDTTPWFVQLSYKTSSNGSSGYDLYIQYINDIKEEEKDNYDENSTEWQLDHFCSNKTSTQLKNTKLYDLPHTGGMGTYWFMVIGAMMMGFALTTGLTKMFAKKKL